MTAPMRVRRDREGVWFAHCRHCQQVLLRFMEQRSALNFARGHLRTHTPRLRDTTGWVALLGPAAVWCPLCDQRIANGLAEDEARHAAAEHWDWHLGELGRKA